MGGINHQPCKHYLPESTKLSRAMSLARMSFEQANVCLEDLVLSELAGGTGSVDPIMEHLRGSTEYLTEMEACANRLFGKMDELHFVDLPPLKTIDFGALGTKLVNMGMVSPESWGCVVRTIKVGGFRSILTMIREKVRDLRERTKALAEGVEGLSTAPRGEAHLVLEENRPGNIKIPFAQVYNEWAVLQQLFLASSLSSTEQWYHYMDFGSIVDKSAPAAAVA